LPSNNLRWSFRRIRALIRTVIFAKSGVKISSNPNRLVDEGFKIISIDARVGSFKINLRIVDTAILDYTRPDVTVMWFSL